MTVPGPGWVGLKPWIGDAAALATLREIEIEIELLSSGRSPEQVTAELTRVRQELPDVSREARQSVQ